MKDHANQLELDLDDANDKIDQLKWRLEQCEHEIELQVARAAQDNHRKELEACDELITLLKEKLQGVSKLSSAEARSSISGSGCIATGNIEKKSTVGEKKATDSPTLTVRGRTVCVNLVPLPTFAGEESKDDEDSFD